MQARFNERVEETVTEAQVEMEAISTDVPALRHATEALERGAELLAERQRAVPSTPVCPATCRTSRPDEGW